MDFAELRRNWRHYRIDAQHSNPYAEWVRQGKAAVPGKVCSMMQSRPEMVWKSWKTIRPLR